MIGVFDYTVILTFLSLLSAVLGMTQAINGHFRTALICLALCGLFDAFDGRVARTKKDRSEEDKLYGIQLDSLVDVVSFGVFPIMICFLMGVDGFFGYTAMGLYAICGVTRLAFYNVQETNRQSHTPNEEKVYHGLPITSISVILPLTFLTTLFTSPETFCRTLTGMLFITAICFIIDFRMRAIKNWMLIVLILIVACAAAAVFLFAKYRSNKIPVEGPLYEEIMEETDDASISL